MTTLILTPRIIRDTLALNGALGLRELTAKLGLNTTEQNLIQAYLLDLASAGEVSYNYDTGAWETDLVLS